MSRHLLKNNILRVFFCATLLPRKSGFSVAHQLYVSILPLSTGERPRVRGQIDAYHKGLKEIHIYQQYLLQYNLTYFYNPAQAIKVFAEIFIETRGSNLSLFSILYN